MPRDKQRYAKVVVIIGISHRGTVKQQGMIQEIAVTIRGILHLLDQMSRHADVVLVQPRKLFDHDGVFGVVRKWMELSVDTAFGKYAIDRIATEFERTHAC